MKSIGFIGLGEMGYALLSNLMSTNSLDSYNVLIYNRSINKAKSIKNSYPSLIIEESVELLIEKSDIIISSVTAEAQKSILEVIKGDKHFISVSNALLIKEMSKVYPGRVSRVMPTVALGGYTLITKGAEDIKDIFSKISTPIVVEEKDFDLFTLITSSGPGLFTTILEVLVDRFSENTNYDKNIIKDMINSTFSSTLKTLIEQNIEYKTLINRVATKGGLTEVGVNVIRQNMPKVVSNVIESSLKYNNKKTKENIF